MCDGYDSHAIVRLFHAVDYAPFSDAIPQQTRGFTRKPLDIVVPSWLRFQLPETARELSR
jgi:hypothetical protein